MGKYRLGSYSYLSIGKKERKEERRKGVWASRIIVSAEFGEMWELSCFAGHGR